MLTIKSSNGGFWTNVHKVKRKIYGLFGVNSFSTRNSIVLCIDHQLVTTTSGSELR